MVKVYATELYYYCKYGGMEGKSKYATLSLDIESANKKTIDLTMSERGDVFDEINEGDKNTPCSISLMPDGAYIVNAKVILLESDEINDDWLQKCPVSEFLKLFLSIGLISETNEILIANRNQQKLIPVLKKLISGDDIEAQDLIQSMKISTAAEIVCPPKEPLRIPDVNIEMIPIQVNSDYDLPPEYNSNSFEKLEPFGIFSDEDGLSCLDIAYSRWSATIRIHKHLQNYAFKKLGRNIFFSGCMGNIADADDRIKIYTVDGFYHGVVTPSTSEKTINFWVEKFLPWHIHYLSESFLRSQLSYFIIPKSCQLSALRDCAYLKLFENGEDNRDHILEILKNSEAQLLSTGLVIEYQANKRPATCAFERIWDKKTVKIKNGELRIGFPKSRDFDWYKFDAFFDYGRRQTLLDRKNPPVLPCVPTELSYFRGHSELKEDDRNRVLQKLADYQSAATNDSESKAIVLLSCDVNASISGHNVPKLLSRNKDSYYESSSYTHYPSFTIYVTEGYSWSELQIYTKDHGIFSPLKVEIACNNLKKYNNPFGKRVLYKTELLLSKEEKWTTLILASSIPSASQVLSFTVSVLSTHGDGTTKTRVTRLRLLGERLSKKRKAEEDQEDYEDGDDDDEEDKEE